MNFFKNISILVLLFSSVLFISCQKEKSEIITEDNENTSINGSSLGNLLSKIVMNDGNNGDYIDGSSWISIAFPFTVIANDTAVLINSEDDYLNVWAIINESLFDEDIVVFNYPITVIFPDYTNLVINSQEAYFSLLTQCESLGTSCYNSIDCIDFVYPITLFVYNPVTELSETVLTTDDEEMYLFLSNIEENDVIEIEYPVSISINTETILQVENDSQLEAKINECVNAIDETIVAFEEYLTASQWYVTNYVNEEIETTNYCEFVFAFSNDGTITITDGIYFFNGDWIVVNNDGILTVDLDFETTETLNQLNDTWFVTDSSNTNFSLEDDKDEGIIKSLQFSRQPINLCINPAALELFETVTDGLWHVALYLDNDEDETYMYYGYEWEFNPDFTVVANDSSETFNGTWEILGSEGTLELLLDFGSLAPFVELNDSWNVFEVLPTLIELDDYISEEDNEVLVLKKL